MYTFASCQTFAGGFDMGMVQAGFKFVHKVEQQGGFGMLNCTANKDLLGQFTHEAGDYKSWHAPRVDVLAANPPCSGFSLMTDHRWRGEDAKINACMWVVMDYAARIRPAIVIMESVRQAYTGGHALMTALRADLEEKTGLRYNLFHVMQNALELGGAAHRPRYFWTAVREDIPFGVEFPAVRTPTFMETIVDLSGMALTWEHQPYRREANWWTAKARNEMTYVDGHMINRIGVPTRRALDLLTYAEQNDHGWPEGWWIGKLAQHIYEKHGELPASWADHLPKLLEKDFHMGFISMTRWNSKKAARVITGSALNLVLHPTEPRTLTHREVARVMGFPDAWKIMPLRHSTVLPMTWGKGITVQCGQWIGEWCRAALDGNPGTISGDLVADREWLIQSKPKKLTMQRKLIAVSS